MFKGVYTLYYNMTTEYTHNLHLAIVFENDPHPLCEHPLLDLIKHDICSQPIVQLMPHPIYGINIETIVVWNQMKLPSDELIWITGDLFTNPLYSDEILTNHVKETIHQFHEKWQDQYLTIQPWKLIYYLSRPMENRWSHIKKIIGF